MNARILDGAESSEFDALAVQSGKVFYSPAWARLFDDSLLRIGVFSKKGALVGGYCLVEDRRLGVKFLRNPPFTPVCGPFFNIEAKHPVAVLEARRKILDAFADFLLRQRFGGVMVSLDHDVSDVMPFCWKGFKTTPRYTYQIDLGQSFEEIVRGFSSARRRNVSAGEREGLIVEPAGNMDEVCNLVIGTFKTAVGANRPSDSQEDTL